MIIFSSLHPTEGKLYKWSSRGKCHSRVLPWKKNCTGLLPVYGHMEIYRTADSLVFLTLFSPGRNFTISFWLCLDWKIKTFKLWN